MRTLKQEMQHPLPEVERIWLRRGATIMLSPLVLIISIFFRVAASFIDATNETLEFIKDCW